MVGGPGGWAPRARFRTPFDAGLTPPTYSVSRRPRRARAAGGYRRPMMTDVVWIKTFPDADAARGARERLAARGVESVVAEHPASSLPTLVPPVAGFRVGVHADDVKAALAVLWGPIPNPNTS